MSKESSFSRSGNRFLNPSPVPAPSNNQHPQRCLPCSNAPRNSGHRHHLAHTLPTSAVNPGVEELPPEAQLCPIPRRPPRPIQLFPKRAENSCSCNQLIARERKSPPVIAMPESRGRLALEEHSPHVITFPSLFLTDWHHPR